MAQICQATVSYDTKSLAGLETHVKSDEDAKEPDIPPPVLVEDVEVSTKNWSVVAVEHNEQLPVALASVK